MSVPAEAGRPAADWREASRTVLLGIAAAGVAAAVAVRALNYELRRDEQMYASAGKLVEDHALYADVFYNHVPGSAWLFHYALMATGGEHVLLAARLATFGALAAFALGAAWLVRALTGSAALALAAALIVGLNEQTLSVAGMAATNNLLPLPLAMGGLGLLMLATRGGRASPAQVGLAGVLLALAATMKASAVCFIPAAVLGALLLPRGRSLLYRLGRVVLPLAAGGFAGAAPVLAALARDPEVFLAHVVRYHSGPHVAFWAAADEPAARGLFDRLQLGLDIWFSGANLVFLFLALLMVLLIPGESLPARARRALHPRVIVAAAAFAGALAMSAVPAPSFPQYWFPPLAAAPLLLATLHERLGREGRATVAPALIAASVALAVMAAPRLAQTLPRAADPGGWTVFRIHDQGREIARILQERGLEGPVATMAPIYPLEGGLPVYPELATGPFATRVAPFADPELFALYRAASVDDLEKELEADPPAALLLGFEPELEVGLLRYARAHGYEPDPDFEIRDRYGRGVLHLPPRSP